MIYSSDESTRRTLTFPATIRPCECVSPTTLITSLLSLSSSISSFKSQRSLFTSNKRNALHAIRLIDVLTLILQDLARWGKPERATSSLSDLHVTLQGLLFLLRDLTGRDGRVWMLANAGAVAGRLRALMGSVAGSLRAVPVGAWEGGEEVRECVALLIRQGEGMTFEVEEGDAIAMEVIACVRSKVESRVIPDPRELKRVLGYLGVERWSDCNREVKFLEELIGSDTGMGSGSGGVDAISLMGLMVYCRCVLFQAVDNDENRQSDRVGLGSGFDMGCLNPDEFKCPISLEIMWDPVTIQSGQTYDRASILKWFGLGNPVCPKTGRKLDSLELMPNLALSKLIKLYCSQNGIPFPKLDAKKKRVVNSSGDIGSLSAQEAIEMAVDFLTIKLAMGTMVEKAKAAYEVRVLTRRSVVNRECCMRSGVIPYLLNLLLSKDSTTQESSIASLLNLSKHGPSRALIIDNEGVARVVRVLRSGITMEARQHAAATLFHLSTEDDIRGLIGFHSDAIPALMDLIRAGGRQGRKTALAAISSLLLDSSNHRKVLEAGMVPLLVIVLRSVDGQHEDGDDVIAEALAVLSSLGEKADGARAILRSRALGVIVRILCSSESPRVGREHCVALLLALCANIGEEVVEVLVKNTSLMGALYNILTKGSVRGRKKVTSLISLLHEFSEKRSSARSLAPRALPHDNFIHVW